MDFGFINDSEDVMMRMRNDDGTELTFITAPSSAFEDGELGPIVTGWAGQIVVAFNKEKMEQMISDSIEKNGEEYGESEAAFLPIGMILRKGIEEAMRYLNQNN